jgi:hypothetical protein
VFTFDPTLLMGTKANDVPTAGWPQQPRGAVIGYQAALHLWHRRPHVLAPGKQWLHSPGPTGTCSGPRGEGGLEVLTRLVWRLPGLRWPTLAAAVVVLGLLADNMIASKVSVMQGLR